MARRDRPSYSENDLTLARAGRVEYRLGSGRPFRAPRRIPKTGIRNQTLVGLYRLREIGTGIGLLVARDPMLWVWARVGGDALDMGTLASGVTARNPRQNGALAGLLMVVGLTALDLALAGRLHGVAERKAHSGS
jgi:hypothetical protein